MSGARSVLSAWTRALRGSSRRIGTATRAELEASLIAADVGTDRAARLCAALSARSGNDADARVHLSALVADILRPCEKPIDWSVPSTVIFVGVNGSGKTTTIGKLAALLGGERVVIAACDTFRAAATEQLSQWASTAGALLVQAEPGRSGIADPSGIAFRAVQVATDHKRPYVFVDTAGRLHDRPELMAEMAKLHRAAHKAAPTRALHGFVVVDGGSGQNALAQIAGFGAAIDLTGLILTKLDGTARGGIALAIAERFAIPVHYVGLGEGAGDLVAFAADNFARALVGLPNHS